MANKKNKKKKNHSTQAKAAAPAPAKKNLLPWIIGICAVVVVILAVALWPKSEAEKPEEPAKTETTGKVVEDEPAQQEETPAEETPVKQTREEIQAAARAQLETGVSYYADIAIQDYGTVTVKLEPDVAPITVANFVGLAEDGFYDGLTFHRIMEGFMMQGGDPLGNGTGGSDQDILGEFSGNGFENPLSHTKGAISMARSWDNDSASSQFFLVHETSDFLDGQYAVFGYVTEGMEIVDAICEASQPIDNNGTIPSADQPVMESVTIRTEAE